MGTILYFCDLRGPPRPFPRTPWGSPDPRLRTYALMRRGIRFLVFKEQISHKKALPQPFSAI
jgi:hypothetical protein